MTNHEKRLRRILRVFLAAKETEAEIDTQNFPDKTVCGRFWTEQIEEARRVLRPRARRKK